MGVEIMHLLRTKEEEHEFKLKLEEDKKIKKVKKHEDEIAILNTEIDEIKTVADVRRFLKKLVREI
jgi:hypothetical protein